MKDLITKEQIKKLLLTEPMDVVDGDSVYFQVSEELELEICVNYLPYAKPINERLDDGYLDHDTYTMEITMLYLEKYDKFLPLNYTREELQKLSFNDEVEEQIKEKYLND